MKFGKGVVRVLVGAIYYFHSRLATCDTLIHIGDSIHYFDVISYTVTPLARRNTFTAQQEVNRWDFDSQVDPVILSSVGTGQLALEKSIENQFGSGPSPEATDSIDFHQRWIHGSLNYS